MHIQRETLLALLESAPTALLVVGADSRIRFANAEAERLFGYDRGELQQHTVDHLVPGRFASGHARLREEYAQHPRIRPMGSGRTLYGLRKDASEFPVEVSLGPAHTPEGPIVMAVIRDVTERQEFEHTLRAKNDELVRALTAKDHFLARMSHELRTPLNAVIGFTGALLMRLAGPLTPVQSQQLTTVQSSARHLLSIINDLLDLAKIESGRVAVELEDVPCDAVLAEVHATLGPLAEAKGLQWEGSGPCAGIIVRGDRRAVVQILMNLAGNAIKFTPAGRVHLAAFLDSEHASDAVLAVSDSGIGIPQQEQALLFEAFAQLDSGAAQRHEGSGLGLHISQKLARLMGGRITLTSEPGRGSTFRLHLPLAP
jgi:PAS domain S-box-containing protein